MYAILIAAAIIGLDQWAKWLVVSKVLPTGDITVIPGFFEITYVQNFGIAFGMFKNKTLFFIITTAMITVAVAYFIFRNHQKSVLLTLCLALILGGAIGNLIDRIRVGYVIDFLHFSIFPPVFNIADSAIVVGAIALSVLVLFDKNISF